MLLNCFVGEDSWVPWTARRSNQSIIKEISPEYPLEGLMLKLKLQYFGHLMWRTDSLGKTLMLGKIEGRGRRGWQKMRCWMASLTGWTCVWASSGSCWWTGRPACCSPWGCRVGHNWVTKLNWTEHICFRLSGRHYWTFLSKYLHLCSLQDLIFRPDIEWYNLPLEVSTLDILLKHENY